MYNRLECGDYLQNGGDLSISVIASEPPVSIFYLDDQFCINPENQQDLYVTNNSESNDCLNEVTYTWQYQQPVSTIICSNYKCYTCF